MKLAIILLLIATPAFATCDYVPGDHLTGDTCESIVQPPADTPTQVQCDQGWTPFWVTGKGKPHATITGCYRDTGK